MALALAGCAAEVLPAEAPIVGGTRDMNAHPAVVWVYNSDEGGLCTGTIIAPRVVLTAKHCVQPPGWDRPSGPTSVVVGLGDIAGRGTTLRVQSVYTTPGVWTESGGLGGLVGHDIAVLVLSAGVAGITPIPVRVRDPSDLRGQTFTAVGYGQIPSGAAGTKYTVEGTVTGVDLRSFQIYVGAVTCQGDSGGPLITADGEVAGVTSWGTGSCGSGFGAYNTVFGYVDLIQMAIREGGTCLNDGPEVCDGHDNDCNGLVDEVCLAIGEGCTRDDQCVGTTCRLTSAGQICTLPCDARRPGLGCGDGLYCSRIDPGACSGWCVPAATAPDARLGNDSPCTQDEECVSLFCTDPGDGRRRCLDSCRTTDGSCLSNEVCIALAGECGGCVPAGLVSGIPHALGEPCATDAECAPGLTCFADRTEHYCTRPCSEAAGSLCPANYHCRDTSCARGALGGVGEGCVNNADCGGGTFCALRGEQSWCTSLCSATAPCPEHFSCVVAGQSGGMDLTVCAPTGGLVGDACTSGTDCVSGTCSATMGGVCIRQCSIDAPCGPGFECQRVEGTSTGTCRRPAPPATTSGGCTVTPGTGGLPPPGMLLVLSALFLARRRSLAWRS